MVLALSAGEAISANGANREALLSIINSKYRRGVISFSDWRNKSRRRLRNKDCGKHHPNMFTNKKRSESNLQTVFLLLKCARLQRLLNASAKSRGLFRTLCLKSVKRSKNVVGLRARGGIVAAKPIVVAI